MNTRNWPIRSKIVAMVAAPIAALLALWIFATTLTVGPASSLLAARTLLDDLGKPGEAMVAELQRERRLSVIYLAGRDNAAELGAQRVRTDVAVAAFRRHTSSEALTGVATGLVTVRLEQTYNAVEELPPGRGSIDRRDVDAAEAIGLYSGMIDAAFRTFHAMLALPDDQLNREARALTSLGRAREVLGRTDALLAGAFAADRFRDGEYPQLVQIIGTQRFLFADAVAELPDADRIRYERLTEGEAFVRLRAMEERLVVNGGPGSVVPVDERAWQNSYDAVQQQVRDFELAGADELAERATPVAVGILVRLGLAGIIGFLAIVVSVIVAVRVGRALARRLSGLRTTALEVAEEYLPDVVGRLRRGEEVDLAREAPVLDHSSDEIGEVGRAFSRVQQTAVRSAIDEATLRRGLNAMFLNIARRSQTLLHRQLALLDRMERRTTEPEELADLFRVDHLATRMRRHAEDLVILAGATPGRGWRNPVPMVDVIRGAISEIEDYARVDITSVQPAATLGRAVGDVVHLLAELIENAASFSPPHTRIRVAGELVPNGYVIEIEDRGLGMASEVLVEMNQRLAEPPDFDPGNSARLGLFVVSQLGARHAVKVQLRPSPYGGVTAVVLIPTAIVVPGTGALALPGRPALPVGSGPGGRRVVPFGTGPGLAMAPDDGRPGGPGGPGLPVARDIDSTVEFPRDVGAAPVAGSAPASAPGAASAAGAAPARPAEVTAGDDGLPRRVRQSSLAPQLRTSPPGAAERPPVPRRPGNGRPAPIEGELVTAAPARTPEQVRAVMAALQSGTARGRERAAAEPAGDAGRGDPATDGGSAESGRNA